PGSNLRTVEDTSYDGYIARSTNARGVRSVTEVDAYGNTIRTVQYLCESGYTECSNNTGGQGVTTTFEYDRLLGKPTKVIDPNGVIVQQNYYDTAGNVLYATDLDRGESIVYYDSKGRVNKAVDSKGTSVNTTTFDGLNRPKVVVVKDSTGRDVRKETYAYDAQMLGTTSETKLFDYDLGNSALQITTSDVDLLGRSKKNTVKTLDLTDTATLAGQGDPKYITQEKTATYSETGARLLSETKIASSLTGSNLQTIDKVGYTYDEDGKLVKSTDKQTNTDYIRNINYNYKGQPDVIGLGNNSQERYEYDGFGRMTRKVVNSLVGGNTNALFDVNYRYEVINGNTTSLINGIISNLDSSEKNSFSYDSFGRLEGTVNNTTATPNTEYTASYLYDKLGNITEKTEEEIGGTSKSNMSDPRYFSGATNQYKNGSNGCIPDADYISKTGYNAQVDGCPYHALKRADLNDGSGTKRIYYLYDKKGNLVKEVNVTDNTSRVYEYSVLDLPITVSDYNNRTATGDPESKSYYVYGLGGIRVGKVLGADASAPPPHQNEGSLVVINAKGNNDGGEWSKMQLKVNGQMLKEWTVDTPDYSDQYRFTTTTPIDLAVDNVEVYFVNDWYRAGVGDRNLWVASVKVDTETFLTLDTREGRKMWSHGAKWTSQTQCNTEGYMLTDKISCNGYFRLPKL
ncbi:hypothetical protein KC660_01620, partial [Candidatus Dojkabacteria bacterium]|nr:hypothetical protein [Candidatus Dojkabacteria bacterium]